MKQWRNVLICLGVFAAFWLGYDCYLTGAISAAYRVSVDRLYGSPVKDKGVALQQASLNRGDVLVLGSSELDSYVRQNPRDFFPNKLMNSYANVVGRAGTLSLEHSLNVQPLNFSKNQKLVYLVSFTWFISSSVDGDSFNSNFSKYKFYLYMTDPSVPDSDKIHIAHRVWDLLRNRKNPDATEALAYAGVCDGSGPAFGAVQAACCPYLLFEEASLALRDKAQSLLLLQAQKDADAGIPASIDWWEENQKADREGLSKVHDDKYHFDDRYQKYISDKMLEIKDAYANLNLEDSAEYRDYDLFLRTCHRKGLKPLVIIQSVNGWFFDFAGLGKDRRAKVYDRLRGMAEGYGFTAYDLSGLEYTPYAYYDAWHLGWKGWLYVDKKIAEYFR